MLGGTLFRSMSVRRMKRASVIKKLKTVNAAPRLGSGDFVGAVYDTSSQDADLPVAVIIGINYGQRASSGSLIGFSQDDIRYARHINALTGKAHHTVIWNFFPYLTESEWLEDIVNAADEAERIFDSGYVDPFAAFETLIRKLQPNEIIFHGISSAVPILARVALRRVHREGQLVPNLARGFAFSRATKIS